MKYDVCCGWLGLATGSWPPDYYSLLGLPPGAGDAEQIEHEVHARLAKVRAYQLSHPELATEAMNLLAHALLCLSDPTSKQAYDQQRGITPPVPPTRVEPPTNGAVGTDQHVPAATMVDWQQAVPPVRGAPGPAIPSPAVVAEQQGQAAAPPVDPPGVAPPAPVAKPAYEGGQNSRAARRGLGTSKGMLERIYHTRQLLRVWDQAGKFFNKPARKLVRPAEEKELTRRLEEVCELLEDFPPIIGQPGQPGYRIVAMATLESAASLFKGLGRVERDVLAKDWVAAHQALIAHRQFLRGELKALKQQGWLGRSIRATRAALNDHPGWVLFGIGVASVLVVLVNVMIYPKL